MGRRRRVQKNGTWCRKPKNSGGSPRGVSEPPMLLTRKMKKTTTWALCRRHEIARNNGRTSTIDAPVVPMKDASNVPDAMINVFWRGDPSNVPVSRIPDDTVYSAHNRMIKGT